MDVVLPKWGVTMQEGTIAAWLVAEGEAVEEDQPIAHRRHRQGRRGRRGAGGRRPDQAVRRPRRRRRGRRGHRGHRRELTVSTGVGKSEGLLLGDIGSTFIKLVAIDSEGRPLARCTLPTTHDNLAAGLAQGPR